MQKSPGIYYERRDRGAMNASAGHVLVRGEIGFDDTQVDREKREARMQGMAS